MRKILIAIASTLLLVSCSRYQPGDMVVTSIEGPYTHNMCNYSVDGSYSFGSVVIHDTCGKFNVGDRLNVVKIK